MKIYTCPQTNHAVFVQPAVGHSSIAFMCSQGIVDLARIRTARHWTDEELDEIDRLVESNKDCMVAHANAIIDRAFS